jgi:hypothetical protein
MFRGNCCADAAAGDGGDDDADADVFHSRSTVPVSCAFVYYGCVRHVQSGEFRFANYNVFAFHVYICMVHAFFALFLVVLCIVGAVTVMNPLRTAANGYVRMFFRGKLVSLTKDGASGA